MYAWWYVVIVLAELIVVGAVMWIVGFHNDLANCRRTEAKSKVETFKYQKEYIQEVVVNADAFENFALTNTLIEQNQLLLREVSEMEYSVDDVIKGLEICTSGDSNLDDCMKCPFDKCGAFCSGNLSKAALYYLKKYTKKEEGDGRL